MKRILFVCTGNICRSPTAEGVARHFIETTGLSGLVEVDSAGTHGYHAGEAPDPRSQKVAAARGYDLSGLRARKLDPADFQRFDLLLAMDRSHLQSMERVAPAVYRPKLALFMSFARNSEFDEVPDPYYGGPTGFDLVLNMCENAVQGLFDRLRESA
ncbi:low molecular weight phosphotyrosine protein phosphatase [Azoarcus sp. TTM-91]|uniref:low molecular weight protein-tyrosine-phosphatase n=1 Tax=Azoarcus sp. TTM-91 TaxID=2691581 RepID=UPI00145FC9C7|nr:low molecular weight protein-tyrosine-phosphatase [Azoarcus sp. TTM-91]NMG34087.1 low molecular weight phosphotyrosine protein phosphatase [Azoarcus sp. TTM-91]